MRCDSCGRLVGSVITHTQSGRSSRRQPQKHDDRNEYQRWCERTCAQHTHMQRRRRIQIYTSHNHTHTHTPMDNMQRVWCAGGGDNSGVRFLSALRRFASLFGFNRCSVLIVLLLWKGRIAADTSYNFTSLVGKITISCDILCLTRQHRLFVDILCNTNLSERHSLVFAIYWSENNIKE